MSQTAMKSRFSGRIERSCCNQAAMSRDNIEYVVAVPACNEVKRVLRCVDAIDDQRCIDPKRYAVLILVNGSVDGTYDALSGHRNRWRCPVVVVECALAANHRNAGMARYVASCLALAMTDARGALLFTTDADSMVPPDWIVNYSSMLRDGCDAVAGLSDLLHDCGDLPASLLHRGDCEDRYTTLLDQIESLVDPIRHDPWPRHYSASGANIAMRAKVFRGLEEQAWPPFGEDKAVIEGIESRDYRVRHDTGTRVLTSGRLFGRASGGMADTMRQRIVMPESPCDERIEPVSTAYLRASCRARLRQLHGGHAGPNADAIARALAVDLHLPAERIEAAIRSRHFGSAWRQIESLSRVLARHALAPSRLPYESEMAHGLLQELSLHDEPTPIGTGRLWA